MSLENAYSFDTTEQANTNTMIVGQTSSGKTRLGWAIADILIKSGWTVYVFDVVGNWSRSSVPRLIKLEPNQINVIKVYGSTVFDISALRISKQLEIVDQFSQWIWEDRNQTGNHTPTLIILEESQNYIKNVKSAVAENLFRLAMSGRNYGVRLCYISPRLNNIAAEFRFLANQRYIGLAIESNVINKIRSLYGKTVAEVVKTLEPGEFIYAKAPEPPKLVKLPLFKPLTNPTLIQSTKYSPKPESDIYVIAEKLIKAFITLVQITIFVIGWRFFYS